MPKSYPTASHLTAIRRVTPSAPARYLYDAGLFKGRVLDYGCGHGKDADTYGMDKYDIYWYPTQPTGQYDTILATYVLNVVPPEDIPYILQYIRVLLVPGGTAYLTVRRDLGGRTRKGRGTLQRDVHLNLQVFMKTSRYCIYILE
jgi:ATP adenylyltransferase